MNTWTTEWPTGPGFYWFYGKCFTQDPKDDLYFVKVRRTPDGSTFYVTNGHFIYRSEGAGAWQPVVLPALPRYADCAPEGPI